MDALSEGPQIGGQQGVGPLQVTQDADHMTAVPLGEQQHRAAGSAAACWVLGGNLGEERGHTFDHFKLKR